MITVHLGHNSRYQIYHSKVIKHLGCLRHYTDHT